MAAPLLLLGLAGVGGIGSGMWINKAATESATLDARIAGVPAVPVLGVGGALLALMGGTLLAPLGVGMMVGSLVAGDGMKRVRTGLEALVTDKIKAQLQAPSPPALPGPGYDAPPAAPGAAPGGGFLSWLLPPAGPQG